MQRPGGAAYDYAYHDTMSGGPDGALRTETLPDVLGAGSRPTVSYTYRPSTATPSSGNSALSSVEHSDGVRLSYEYDGPARRGETLSVLEGSTWTERGHVTRDPDDDLRVGTLRIGAGDVANDVVVPMSYDADGVPTQVGPMALTNDAATGVLLGTSAGVVTTAQRYTAFGELSALRSTRGMTAGLTFDYRYDPLGRLKVVTESDGGSTVSVRCYTYDTAGRLAGVYSAADAAMATCTGSPIASYGYDTNGNRVSSTGTATVATSAATIDEQDRLTALTVGGVATTFAYTARGELLTRTAGSDVTTYRYDARGALASVTLPDASVVQYRNDPQGRRIERSYGGETRRWLYDGLRIVREEIGPTPTGGASFAASVVRTFVYGTRGHVPDLVVQGTATYRVVTDHLGSVRQVVDTATGDVVAARSYDAWGRVTSDTTSDGFVALPQAYAGGIYDVQTGLVRFGARDYDSVLGRWTAKDPIGFLGSSVNFYDYSFSDPINFVDTNGHEGWSIRRMLLNATPLGRSALFVQDMFSVAWLWANKADYMNQMLDDPRHDHDRDDKFFHCVALCTMARSTLGGILGDIAGYLHDTDEPDDRRVNQCGLENGRDMHEDRSDTECADRCASQVGTAAVRDFLSRNHAVEVSPDATWSTQDPNDYLEQRFRYVSGNGRSLGRLLNELWRHF